MDKQHRETIRLLVSKARALVVETQDAKRGSRRRDAEPAEPYARASRARLPRLAVTRPDAGRIESRPGEVRRSSQVRSQTMSLFDYRYELRRHDELIATGHITRDQAVEVGERIVISGLPGIVRTIEPPLGELGPRLLVELLREGTDVVENV